MLTKESQEEMEFAKNQLMNSSLDERCKKSLFRLLNTAIEATNGISTDEKLQKITEVIVGLVSTQITFLDTVDRKIEKANREQCLHCKAMAHAEAVEAEETKKKLIEEWKAANGITDDDIKQDDEEASTSWSNVLKKMITQPGLWFFLTILAISPYGVDIVKALLQFFSK